MWSTKWTKKLILTDEFDAFPIQFANCNRIEANDAVYIFDEVGSGKTTSAGLMALHYLYQRNIAEKKLETDDKKDVVIITINSLVKAESGKKGQFLKDWERLPFVTDEYNLATPDIVKITNNHYRKLLGYVQEKVGLLIVDEAHLFLEDTMRRSVLEKIHAEKVIFLTATPIKHDKYDLYKYSDIASKILGKDMLDNSWIDKLISGDEEMISAYFNPTCPVTRYFKDTIMALEAKAVDDFEKRQSKRLFPHLWKYKYAENRIETMIGKMIEIWNSEKENTEEPPSRFVIFTRYIEKESEAIEKYLAEYDGEDCQFVNSSVPVEKKKTYYSVNGKVSQETGIRPTNFSGKKNLPDILILTYQMAEQGVNLPGYNYIVNYHISAFPASLEQRFGRIDRMGKNGSLYKKINICYLISENRYSADIYTINFYSAVSTYLYGLLTQIPAKNVLLSTDIIEDYRANKSFVLEYLQRIEDICKRENNSTAILDNEEIKNFCIEYQLNEEEDEVSKEDILHKIISLKERFKRYDSKLEDTDEAYATYKHVIKTIYDKIFYYDKEYKEINWTNMSSALRTVDAIKEKEPQKGCAQQISESLSYQNYKSNFNELIKLPRLYEKYAPKANMYFEEKFHDNQFEEIFPVECEKKRIKPLIYQRFKEVIFERQEWLDVKEADKELLLDNLEDFIKTVPFLKMVAVFRKELIYVSYTEYCTPRERIDFHEIRAALARLGYRVAELGMSENFIRKYWNNKKYEDFIYMIGIYRNKEAKTVEATNWYKLAFHCLHSNINRVIYCYSFMAAYKENSSVEFLEALFPEHWDTMKKILDGSLGENKYGNAFRRKLLTYSGYWGKPLESYKGILSGRYPYDGSYKIRPADIWTYGIYWETLSRDIYIDGYTFRSKWNTIYARANQKYQLCSTSFWKSFFARMLVNKVCEPALLEKLEFPYKKEILSQMQDEKWLTDISYQNHQYIDYSKDELDE